MLIQPSTPGYVGARRNWPVLVSIRYLDSGFMRDLESTHLIGRPRFSRTAASLGEAPALPGEHTREALTAWGIDDVDALIAGGAATQA